MRLRVLKLASAPSPGPGTNWVLPPDGLLKRLRYEEFEIRSLKETASGKTGALKARLFFPADGVEFDVKWKAVPHATADGWNNSPRKELAAYALQQLFLDPEDYVVPTVTLRCVPLETSRLQAPKAVVNVEGTRCVLGVMSIWLRNVASPDRLYDEGRFLEDPNYAYHMANLNLLTYLIDHRDWHESNILVSSDSGNRRVFAVDNGIAFDSWVYKFWVSHWNSIRVPALRKESIDRLRDATRSELDKLGVLIQMEIDENRILRPVAADVNWEPSKGARVLPGMIQLGLTESEIDGLAERMQELLEEVDAGNIPLF